MLPSWTVSVVFVILMRRKPLPSSEPGSPIDIKPTSVR
jgi:hypothetical protein